MSQRVSGTRCDRIGIHGSTLCYCNVSHNCGTVDCYKISNGSKSFDTKTSSTRAVAGSRFMTNPHHTQKIDSEPSGRKMFIQKSESPDARFVMSY